MPRREFFVAHLVTLVRVNLDTADKDRDRRYVQKWRQPGRDSLTTPVRFERGDGIKLLASFPDRAASRTSTTNAGAGQHNAPELICNHVGIGFARCTSSAVVHARRTGGSRAVPGNSRDLSSLTMTRVPPCDLGVSAPPGASELLPVRCTRLGAARTRRRMRSATNRRDAPRLGHQRPPRRADHRPCRCDDDPPHRQDDVVTAKRPIPRERVLIVRIGERSIEIQQGSLTQETAFVVLRWPICLPSRISSIIFSLNAGMSSGLRLVTSPWSTTTSSSTQSPPALRISV